MLVIGRRQKHIKFSDLYADTLIKKLDVPQKNFGFAGKDLACKIC
jgi:hypothetical protein